MSFENETPFKRTGSIRNAMNRFRSSMRNKFGFTSVRVTKSEKNQQKRKQMQQENSLQPPPTVAEDECYETYNYKGNAKDVARRFVNISRHKAQETYVAAKLVLKLKKADTPNVSSDEGDGLDSARDFLGNYRFSFSDDDDVFPVHKNERYIGASRPPEEKPLMGDANSPHLRVKSDTDNMASF